jgi:PncC family amidohydrolase
MTVIESAGQRPAQEHPRLDVASVRKIGLRDHAVRFAFGAAMSVIAAVIGIAASHRLAGLFLAFPAILPAALTLLERKEGLAQAVSDVRGATIGAIGMFAFALTAAVALPHSPQIALPAAMAAWIVVSVGIYAVLRLLVHILGERQFLPEIPTTEAMPAIECLRQRRLTLGLAESCTGGTIASLITSVPGAGDVLRGGVVAYSNESKTAMLGVDPDIIAARGAVSASVAREMARGAAARFGADVGLGVTGLLGTPRNDEGAGTTYIALSTPDGRVLLRHFSEDHGPGRNRERDVRMALKLLVDGIAPEA